jgi:hypothetical protein
LPVSLFCDGAPGHLQQVRSNYLTRLAAQEYGADWALPLDADEILTGPDRSSLEHILEHLGPDAPASLPLLDYCPTTADDTEIANPVLRLRHCQRQPAPTRKIFIPRPLALDRSVAAGKGSHALCRGDEILSDRRMPAEYLLAHLSLRSPQQQLLRVVRAELQRRSRGRLADGLDVHYRLGYQLLATNPELFFTTVCPPAAGLRLHPIHYRGGPLRYSAKQDWARVARALLPYLDQLAASHGRLADATGFDVAAPAAIDTAIRELTPADLLALPMINSTEAFVGFTAGEGWGPQEGPVPEAFLPPFHWGYAPATTLKVHSPAGLQARFAAEALTYSENQQVMIELNGSPVLRHTFGRVYQKEALAGPLSLHPGENLLTFRYSECLRTAHDPRLLAVIFLSLQILHP